MKLMIRLLFILVTLFTINITVYAYTEYKIGDIVPYNGMEFYVIKDSSSKDDSVTMLKSEPLTVAEVNTYGGVGTTNNHVNMYATSDTSASYYQTAYNRNGYGGMAYYTSETCGYNGNSGCKSDYASSEIKYVVDAWKTAQAPAASEARLISKDEIEIERKEYDPCGGCGAVATGDFAKYNWMYNNNCGYWTMSPYNDSSSVVWYVHSDGRLSHRNVNDYGYSVVRPVITLPKIALGDEDKSITDDKDIKKQSENKSSDNKKETITKVKVENTYKSQTLIIMIIGFISICSGVVIYYLIKNKVISRR